MYRRYGKLGARRSTCPTRKTRFRDQDEAKIVLGRAKSSTDERRREVRCYHCHLCQGWHLTSRAS